MKFRSTTTRACALIAAALFAPLFLSTVAVAATDADQYGANIDGWKFNVANGTDFDVMFLAGESSKVSYKNPVPRGIVSRGSDATINGKQSALIHRQAPANVTLEFDSLELGEGWTRFIEVKSNYDNPNATVYCGIHNAASTHLGGCTVDNRLSDRQPNLAPANEPIAVTFTTPTTGVWARSEQPPVSVNWGRYGVHHDGFRLITANRTSFDIFSAGGKQVSYSPEGIARGGTELSTGKQFSESSPHNATFRFDSLDLKEGWKRFVRLESTNSLFTENHLSTFTCGIESPSGEWFEHGCKAPVSAGWNHPFAVDFIDAPVGPWTPGAE